MRKWLQPLVDEYLQAVAPLQHSEDDRAQAITWAHWMRQRWAKHGLADLKQQRNLMTDVRGAIKSRLGTDHVALETMNFTIEEWTTINAPIAEQVALRNENVVLLNNPDAIVALAVRLLESRQWADIAAGLVVLTGRRSSEILATAEFKVKSQWSVRFTGALKRRGEVQRLSFEIPTLTTAERVVRALDKLRAICPSHGLSAQQINQKYAHAVASACDRHFTDLVPKRQGRENLFTHLFRSVYAAIATLWFAPASVDASEYKAAIQGHYALLEEPDSDLRRSLTASRHYNDYKIADANGNIDGRQGIKLGHGGVGVIDAFNPVLKEKKEVIQMISASQPSEEEGFAIDNPQPLDKFTQEDATVMESEQAVSQQAIEHAAIELLALPNLEAEAQSSPAAAPPKKRTSRRIKPVSIDLDLLTSVTTRFGVTVRKGKGRGFDHALLELLLLLEHQPIHQDDATATTAASQTVADQAKTLAWLTGRVEQLEAQLEQQQRENMGTIREEDSNDLDQIQLLQAENLRLNDELQLTRSRLDRIQTFLSGSESKAPVKDDPQQPSRLLPPETTPHAPVTTTAGATLEPVSKTPSDLDPDALRALHAILDFNDHTATSHGDRWAISFPAMKELLKQVGKATQPKIEAVLRANSDIIQEHHRRHGLGDRHNRVHKGHSISDVIKI
jgi:hypothetical protein